MTGVTWVQDGLLLVQAIVLGWTGYLIKRYADETTALRRATERYADETATLRKETVRQNQIAVRPIVLPDFTFQQERSLQLKNCGAGSALNVTISSIQVPAGDPLNLGPAEIRFGTLDYLPSGEHLTVRLEVWAGGQKVGGQSPLERYFLPQYPGPEMKMEICFEDVESDKYRVMVHIHGAPDAPGRRQVRIGKVERAGSS
jgi:hypothetical protein